MSLAALGAKLRSGGLTPRALAAWAGTDRLSALPARLPRGEPTPAATLLALFVAGDSVPVDRVTALGSVSDSRHPYRAGLLDELDRLALIDFDGKRVRARVSILPLGPSLLVCDRLDTIDSLDVVCWPDDSSYHTALAAYRWAAQRERWLDLGCGSAFAPLMRPELAHEIGAADVNPRAVRYARLGGELSGISMMCWESDLGDGVPASWRASCQLVTCNAPIPHATDSPYRARWRITDASFVERLFAHARTFVAPDGLVVLHAAADALLPIVRDLAGERVVVTYTPEGTRAFALAWWRPSADARLVATHRPLTDWRPHLTHEDRLAALASS